MKQAQRRTVVMFMAAALFPAYVQAQDELETIPVSEPSDTELGAVNLRLFGGDFSYNGMFRLETSMSANQEISAANQRGLKSNGRPIKRAAGNPVTDYETTLSSGPAAQDHGNTPRPLGVDLRQQGDTGDMMTRYVEPGRPTMNYHALRFETSASINWEDFSFQARLRAIYDPGELGYADFNFDDYLDVNRGFETGFLDAGRQYRGTPDYFGYEVDGERNPLLFERSGKNYSVDFPAFFLQWTNGDITARLGNQSVAWGQLLFFRIMDQANGLDLRRHLFMDRAIEEFADERMSAPGLRVTWQATDQILIDSFAQQFIPTIVPNSNTPYNVVDSRFILHDNYFDGGYNEEMNYGVRLKAEFGQYNFQLMATSKLNQLGAIRWAKSGINKKLPDTNELGATFNTYCEEVLGSPAGQGCGPQMAEVPFESGPAGLFSAEEWFDRASYTKLHALDGLRAIVDDFQPVTGQLLTVGPTTAQQAYNELNAFFIALEGAHGHVERDYFREEVYGVGAGYVTEGELGSFWDQIIINLEATYTPERVFSDLGLRKEYDKREEVQVGLVVEKYHRFTPALPATYMVFQYLWQQESSLEGLLLDGYGSSNYSSTVIQGAGNEFNLTPGVPLSTDPNETAAFCPGVNHANYVVLAALMPGPQYIFEYSIASLIDIEGGILVQPGIQWKPRGNITVNLFYNYLDAQAWGDNPNNSFVSLIDHADETTLRLGYQF